MLYLKNFKKNTNRQFKLGVIFLSIICLFSFCGTAQLINGNAFLRGNYVEMAVGPCGVFCSNVSAPTGYHPRGPVGNYFSDSSFLGFVADPARDGWNTGYPNYVGDYFLPGSPEEGFGISVNGYNYNNNTICNETGIPGNVIKYGSTTTQTYAVWQGGIDGLIIKAKTYVPTNSVYFVTEVSITNTSLSPAYNVYYMRNVDPDQGVMTPGGNGYETLNSIVYQNPEICNRALVSSTSLIGNYYLGLGSIDSRARVSYGGFSNRSASDIYNGYGVYTSGSLSDDIAISISFNLGTIEPNQTVKFAYAYILNSDQLNLALSETNLNYAVNGLTYTNNTLANTCSGTNNDISIVSPSGYSNWTWTPNAGITSISTNGQNVSVNLTAPITYTVIGSGVCGTTTLTIPLSPVILNPPGPARMINGPTLVDPGSVNLLYFTDSILNATNYIWTLPPGFVSTGSNTNSTQITLNGPNAGGCSQLKVYGKNACGNGQETAITVCIPGIDAGSLTTSFSTNSLCSPLSSSITYTSNNIQFNADNYFTVQLSDANGDFSLPYYIGSLTGTQANGTIPIYIEAGMPTGNGYRFKLFSSSPYYESTDNGMGLFMSTSIPPAPTTITQELLSNNCGGRIYRYTASGSTTDLFTGYMWTLPRTVGGVSGVYVDSGDINSSRVIKVKYLSNAAASNTDSVKVNAYSGCGLSPIRSVKLINTLIAAPAAPASITITPITTNRCDGKFYRYAAPALVAATSTTVAATGWQWSFVGSLSTSISIDSGSMTSQIIRVKFTNNNAATTGDSVRVAYTSTCGNSTNRAAILTNTLLTSPSAPASITITQVTNDCNSRIYRYTAPALVAATATSVGATGWQWVFVGPLNSSTTATIDSGTLTSQIVRIKYLTNNPAYAGDSVRVAYSSSTCGLSPYKSAILTNTFLAPPPAPSGITITLVSATCGNVLYRYAAPALVSGTSTSGGATGWAWSFIGTLGTNAVIDSGTNGSQVIRVKFTSSAASAAGDSVRVCYTSGCGNSAWKSAKLTNTALAAPPTPTSVTITAISTNICNNKVYRYTAPALTGTATGWQWSFVGSLGANAVIDSGTLTSRILRMKFLSNVASKTGDSARVMYTSTCGNSPNKSQKLTNALLSAPAAPTAITTTALITNICGGRVYRYAAPALPVASATVGAATGYIWSFTGPLHTNTSTNAVYTIDSGTINSRIIKVRYYSNTAASTTDSVRVCYTSDCGNSPNKSSKLTLTALNTPAAPATLTQTLVSNVCSNRTYRFATSALVSATTSAGAASGWEWSFVGSLGLNATIDSGTLNSQVVRMKFTLNSAAATGDSARVAYTSGCGTGARKTAKLNNISLLCLAKSIPNNSNTQPSLELVEIYPNPTSNEFYIQNNAKSNPLVHYRLLDANGRLLEKSSLCAGRNKQIGSQLKSGIYFIEFITEGGRLIKKLVKQ